MTTVLLYTSPARGHLYPMMDVAVALRARGHRVVVQTLADQAAAVQAAGVEHRPVDPRIEALPLEDWQGSNPLDALRRTLARWVERAPFEVLDLRAALPQVQPQALLVDVHCFGAAALAETTGLPWASHLPYVLPVPSRQAPAFGPGFPPPTGALDRARDQLVWAVQGMAARGPLAPLHALRRELGAAPLASFTDLFTSPPVLFHRTAEPFEYPRTDWPGNHRAIGPGLWAPPAAPPDWLALLPRPRTLVSVSTEHQDDAPIVQAALSAFADQPGGTLVTTAAQDPGAFSPPHDRIRLARFLSHAAVMDGVDLVVTHGGMGTTQRALAAGVPLVVVPWGRDQLETARRVERCGAGVVLPRGRLSPARLREAADRARGMKAGAERVAAAFAAAGGAGRVVEWVEGRA
ncbi:glycosyltransferase [Myxococcota bacterium]|nr:glycosyltransferase [Myxococcota bacterium]